MITPTMMYWITRLDGIRYFLHGFDVMTIILFIGALILAVSTGIICIALVGDSMEPMTNTIKTEDYKIVKRIRTLSCKIAFYVLLPINIVISLAYALTPSTKEYCAIKVVPAIMNNAKVQEFGDELYRLGVDWLKELRPQDKATSADSAKESVEPKQ